MLPANVLLAVGIAIAAIVIILIFAYSRLRLKYPPAIQYYNQGIVKAKQGDYTGAIEAFTLALQLNPNLVEAYNKRGHAHLLSGDKQRAIEDYSQAIQLNLNTTEVYINRGYVRADLGDFRGSITDYQKAANIFLKQNDPTNYRKTLDILKNIQRKTKADDPNLEEGARLSETPTEADDRDSFRQGLYEAKIGNHKGAIEHFNKALQLNPQDSQIYYNRGLARFKLEDNRGAIADFTRSLQIDPNYSEAYLIRGNVHRKQGSYQQAIQDYTQVIEGDPRDAKAYYNRAIAYADRGDKRRSLQDKQNSQEDYQKAANLFFERGDMVNYQRCMKSLPKAEMSESFFNHLNNADSLPSNSSKKSISLNQSNQKNQPPSYNLQTKLLILLNGDRAAAERLISQVQAKNPAKSIDWCVEKVIYDLKRDRER